MNAFDGMTVAEMDDFDRIVERRNAIQLEAEDAGCGTDMWLRLGIANRHIKRVVEGKLKLHHVVSEIEACFRRAQATKCEPVVL